MNTQLPIRIICQQMSVWIALGGICLVASTANGQEKNVLPPSKPITIGTSYSLKSRALGDVREINIWTPPSYQSGEREYPTLYVIDGGLDQDFHHISGLAQLATINGSFRELIVVGIRTNNRYDELIHPMQDAGFKSLKQFKDRVGRSADFLKHIKTEVIPFVEGKYRVTKRRAIIGESLAGLFIAEVFLESPSSFQDYICISPSLWWDNMRMAKNTPELLDKNETNGPTKIYVTMANEGGMMKQGLLRFVDAIEAKVKTNEKAKKDTGQLECFFVNREKTHTHATIYHPAALDALIKLFPIQAQKNDD